MKYDLTMFLCYPGDLAWENFHDYVDNGYSTQEALWIVFGLKSGDRGYDLFYKLNDEVTV